MHANLEYTPDYIFESSWEVCNKVGGIYTVLSSRANTLQKEHKDKIIFIGPDIWDEKESPWFKEEENLHKEWRIHADEKERLTVRIGRWQVPGEPIAVLVNFNKFYKHKNDIYGQMWRLFGVDSMPAYGDYDESSMFAYSVGNVIESFYAYYQLENQHVIAHFNEWMLGMGALYVKHFVPKIATIFTTHATSIGRSIAGNNLPLYKHFNEYNGDQMARELNMISKHSIEKIAAHNVDCLTTVSDITARECEQLLEKRPDVVTPNGFEKGFIPQKADYVKQRAEARETLIRVTEALLGFPIATKSLLVALSGRYEYKNKGIDVFIDSLNKLRDSTSLKKDIVAFIMVPAWVKKYRNDLQQRLEEEGLISANSALEFPFLTHSMHQPENDPILSQIKQLGFTNSKEERVKIIFVPSYLNGDDGIFNKSYYDLLIGLDATVFPSYYEPWGYTPHESIAFSIPTVTTSLSGFGAWAIKMGDSEGIDDGVAVIHRDEDNYDEVSNEIAETLVDLSQKKKKEIGETREAALRLADSADWEHFIGYYKQAYSIALHSSIKRTSKDNTPNK
jgi:glycosyltransferase involved in cell wall biosynthesis